MAEVAQEGLTSRHRGLPVMVQQVWVSLGGLATSYAALFWKENIYPVAEQPAPGLLFGFTFPGLYRGWDRFTVLLLLAYTLHGMLSFLLVRELGALGKALCSPLTTGACYFFATGVLGTAAFSAEVFMVSGSGPVNFFSMAAK